MFRDLTDEELKAMTKEDRVKVALAKIRLKKGVFEPNVMLLSMDLMPTQL